MAFTLEKKPFGTTAHGESVEEYTLRNESLAVSVITYGATIRTLSVNHNGVWTDTVLGYDTLAEYEINDGHLGACIGRVGNRIGGAAFTLNGKEYKLAKNDGVNCLHGGVRGFDTFVWSAEPVEDGVKFSRISPDGEEGFPGTLSVSVTYRLHGSALELDYRAGSDRDTLCNLTNHSYFNLNGTGTVRGHELQLFADDCLENSAATLPTGKRVSVEGTVFDFRMPKRVGQDLDAEYLRTWRGYDHNFCLNGEKCAVLRGDRTGITMEVTTTLPGVQLYTANFLTERCGKNGAVYTPHDALCLETQYFPNAMACEGFERPILRAGETWHHTTTFRFA